MALVKRKPLDDGKPCVSLCDKYRPTSLKRVVGQERAVKTLTAMIGGSGVPHALLLTGPPGVGKTTIARILATKHLKCGFHDLQELNIANLTSVDTVRGIDQEMRLSSISGPVRVYILDEVQGMGKPAQQAFLKILEEPPTHVYFFLCTTDPSKLVAAIRSRCTKVRLVPVDGTSLLRLLRKVCKKEGVETFDTVLEKIAEYAEGSARDALKSLEAVRGLKNEEDQLAAVMASLEHAEAIELARVLVDDRKRWADVKKVLNKLRDEEPEVVRRVVVGYVTTVAMSGGKLKRCQIIYDSFRDEFFQTGKSAFSQLVFASLEVVGAGK